MLKRWVAIILFLICSIGINAFICWASYEIAVIPILNEFNIIAPHINYTYFCLLCSLILTHSPVSKNSETYDVFDKKFHAKWIGRYITKFIHLIILYLIYLSL